MFVQFVSDSVERFPGFQATYSAKDAGIAPAPTPATAAPPVPGPNPNPGPHPNPGGGINEG